MYLIASGSSSSSLISSLLFFLSYAASLKGPYSRVAKPGDASRSTLDWAIHRSELFSSELTTVRSRSPAASSVTVSLDFGIDVGTDFSSSAVVQEWS